MTDAKPMDAARGHEDAAASPELELSVVMPCLNEAATVGTCIRKAQESFRALRLTGEIVVCDNGSTDGSAEIATRAGARVVHEAVKGYGSALIAGMKAARGRWILMGDADDTYDFSDIAPFVAQLRAGHDLVVGNRLTDRLEKGAMPWKNRHIGTPLLTAILRFLYRIPIHDSQCGMRALTRETFARLNLKCTGMEFASEMLVKAALLRLRVANIPISYSAVAGRTPYLRPFRDGWRHLKFLLMFAPTHLFFIPASILLLAGLALLVSLTLAPVVHVFGFPLHAHWTIVGSAAVILGVQILSMFFFAKVLALTRGYLPHDPVTQGLYRTFKFEHGLLFGLVLFLIGLGVELNILRQWIASRFGPLDAFRPGILGMTLIIVGIQTVFASFFLSLLGTESGEGRTR